jgi:hypothetical protein
MLRRGQMYVDVRQVDRAGRAGKILSSSRAAKKALRLTSGLRSIQLLAQLEIDSKINEPNMNFFLA